MPSLVSLDIETTGLDPNTDSIIEIGAVRFSGKRIEAEWSTLINPGRPIPPFISQLTGISNDMVSKAPRIREVLAELAAFVGDSPVVGHNVRFDLAFLNRQGVLINNDTVDTYELAAVLLPRSSRYNLSELCRSMGIFTPGAAHRGLEDAIKTQMLFNLLYDKALSLPTDLLAEFVRQSEPFSWGAGWILRQIFKARAREPISARRAARHDSGHWFEAPDEREFIPLQPADPPTALDTSEIASLLEYGGPFARYFNNYEHRPQQVEMLRGVSEALSTHTHLMVEAGTGTGKSFAYLVPAALWAMQNDTRVVISTNTINLQDQLINKDIPDLCAALRLNLRAAVLKGRGNYLCPRRLDLLRQRGPETPEEMRVLAKVLVWLQESSSGDRNEINLNGPAEREVWGRISAEDEGCKTEVCVKRTGGACPFYRARLAAQTAHLLVVNHALLLTDAATGSRVLPEYNYLIIDEGHHLESATTSALSFKLSQGDLERLLRELGSPTSGLMGRFLTISRNVLMPSDYAALNQFVSRATDLCFRLEIQAGRLFSAVDNFLLDARDGRPQGLYPQQVRVLPATRTQPAWTEVEMVWDQARETLKLLLNLLHDLYTSLAEASDSGLPEDIEDLLNSFSNVYRRLTEIDTNVNALVCKPDASRVYWIEMQPNGNRLTLEAAPLNIGPLMRQYLWNEKSSVIVTSATLTTNGEFDYLRTRLDAQEAGELALGSPFDYESAAMLYVVNDIPEPSDMNGHQRAVESALIRLAKATNGRMLVLFTSYSQLKRTGTVIGGPLAEAGISVFEQGDGASANTLLENFRETDKAVLLGTKSFWEGVDIPGDALSVLVIVKLPFDVPSEPIIAARSETFEDPFNEYNLPEAVLRFRQGFGRLIRTQFDRGVVAILDRRILTKRYGKIFIDSLPACTVKVGTLMDLPKESAKWLNM